MAVIKACHSFTYLSRLHSSFKREVLLKGAYVESDCDGEAKLRLNKNSLQHQAIPHAKILLLPPEEKIICPLYDV